MSKRWRWPLFTSKVKPINVGNGCAGHIEKKGTSLCGKHSWRNCGLTLVELNVRTSMKHYPE